MLASGAFRIEHPACEGGLCSESEFSCRRGAFWGDERD